MGNLNTALQSRPAGQPVSRAPVIPFRNARRGIAAAIFLGIGAAIVWLWLRNGGVTKIHSVADLITSLGRITGLLGAYLLLVQVLMLSRLRQLERIIGFDRLTVWHRLNGKVCFYLILAHVVLITIGYSMLDRISIPSEIANLLTIYPGMVEATVGTAMIVVVVVSSFVIVRRKLRYESWYVVHLLSYVAIYLGWVHQIPTGNEFVVDAKPAAFWTALYVVTLGLVILFRLAIPIAHAFWYKLRVAEVLQEGPNVVSLRITGRHLDHMRARSGQFFLWRFLTRKHIWESHPFSLSAAPDGQSMRITVKSLGDFTSRVGQIPPGTRLVGVGPFGLFTEAVRRRDKVALIAGGVGITPLRAMLEDMQGDIVLIYRAVRHEEIVFQDELEALAQDRGVRLCYVIGHHLDPGAERFLTPEHLHELVPDIVDREIYVCGPPIMSEMVQANVREAGVPRKFIHSEAFAF